MSGLKRRVLHKAYSPSEGGVDKKMLSKPGQALHSDGERGRIKENKGEREKERGREEGKGAKQRRQRENEGRETN